MLDLEAVLTPSMEHHPITAAIRRTMRLSIIEGGFSQIFLLWTTGSVLIGYMHHYDASPSHLALVSSVPMLAQVLSPLAAWGSSLWGKRRLLIALLAFIGRGLWFLAAIAPQLGIPNEAMPLFLILVLALSSLFQSSLGTLWTAWMGDMIPEDSRGRYIGLRSGIVGIVGMFASLASGWFLDRVAAPLNFQLVLGVAVVSALIAAIMIMFHYDPPPQGENLNFKELLSIPLQSQNFRRFLLFAALLHFGVFLGAPFVVPYYLDNLRMTFSQIAFWQVIASFVSLFTTSLWGRVADKAGNKGVLTIGVFLMGLLLPLSWIMAGLLQNISVIWVSAVIDAIVWGAAGPALFNLALASSPKENRVIYIAMYSLTIGIAGFISGTLAGPLLTWLNHYEWGRWSGYHSIFSLSSLVRLSSLIPLYYVAEVKAWRTRDLLRYMRPWRNLGFPWRQ
ncbi:MAG: MFS transporter [Deinococcales bacterium]